MTLSPLIVLGMFQKQIACFKGLARWLLGVLEKFHVSRLGLCASRETQYISWDVTRNENSYALIMRERLNQPYM